MNLLNDTYITFFSAHNRKCYAVLSDKYQHPLLRVQRGATLRLYADLEPRDPRNGVPL